jgi:type IV pilus assembly protein PilA
MLGLYAVRRYLAQAKTAEARNSLGAISQGAVAAYEKESTAGSILTGGSSSGYMRSLCASASTTVPADPSAIRGKKYQSSPAEWNVDASQPPVKGFACLRFGMEQPQYFMYGYTITGTGGADGDSFTGVANGDLNGDGVLSTFSITGRIQSGALNVAPHFEEQNAGE